MPEPKPQLHQSQMLRLADCGEYYRLRYVENLKGPRSPRLIVGSAVHASVAQDLTAKIETEALLPDEAVADHTRDNLEAEWNAGDIMTDNEGESLDDAKGEAIDRAVALSDLHHSAVAPEIKPVAVEQKGVIVLNGFPFDIALTKDIIEADGIRDTKTTARAPAEHAAKTSLQLHLYAIHQELKDGVAPKYLTLDYLVRTPKGKKTYHKPITTEPSKERRDGVLALVQRSAQVIQAGAFMANPGSILCSRRYCEFARAGLCKHWSGRE